MPRKLKDLSPEDIQAVGDDATSLINEAIKRYEQGQPGVVTYLMLARGRLKDNGLTSKGKDDD